MEGAGTRETGGAHERDVFVRNEDAFEERVVARRGPHAEGVPRLLDAVALRVRAGTNVCTTFAPVRSSLSIVWIPSQSQTGDRLPKIL